MRNILPFATGGGLDQQRVADGKLGCLGVKRARDDNLEAQTKSDAPSSWRLHLG